MPTSKESEIQKNNHSQVVLILLIWLANYAAAFMRAICLHDSAHVRQMSAQCFIIWSSGPIRSHSSAQAKQISAHVPHVSACFADPRSMKSALVWQMSAQSSSNRM